MNDTSYLIIGQLIFRGKPSGSFRVTYWQKITSVKEISITEKLPENDHNNKLTIFDGDVLLINAIFETLTKKAVSLLLVGKECILRINDCTVRVVADVVEGLENGVLRVLFRRVKGK